MAKGIYLGSASVAKKAKKLYVGDTNGLAGKAKKMYIGDSNCIAQIGWSGKRNLSYYGLATPLSSIGSKGASANVSNYVLLAGFASTVTDAVLVYDDNLIRLTASNLIDKCSSMGGASTPTYAYFAGGLSASGTSYYNAVHQYNGSLTRSMVTPLKESRCRISSTSIGGYALFAGGYRGYSTAYSSKVEAYDDSGTQTILTSLSTASYGGASASNHSYALFAAGQVKNQSVKTVNAYDTSLVQHSTTNMNVSRKSDGNAVSIGENVLFAGGNSSSVDMYDAALTHSMATQLSFSLSSGASASLGDYAIFAGGDCGNASNTGYWTDAVNSYDESCVRSVVTSISSRRQNCGGASVGNYMLIYGGQEATTAQYCATVDVFEVA